MGVLNHENQFAFDNYLIVMAAIVVDLNYEHNSDLIVFDSLIQCDT